MTTTDSTPPSESKTVSPRGEKPLGQKAYGSIPHLPGSRRGPADKGLSEQQAQICTHKARDRHDEIIVQEKLDGSNTSVAKINGEIVALGRAGYRASTSPFQQHHFFHDWVQANRSRFDALLKEGERCVGEWLAQAHGTRYNLTHEPYVIFDIMRGVERSLWLETCSRCVGFVTPRVLHVGGPVSIDTVLKVLEPSGHGAVDAVEGAVWRVERKGAVDFLGKYVRPEKADGTLLPEINGGVTTWNWQPAPVESLPASASDSLKGGDK